ncbi:MAG: putative baseplate assembly protein [Burkholderiales bacterium]|nr:putative baseplate assembly protein [Burkholderiales bacterium]MDE1926032.1 putative baseplate assembly protein [Burkholderiales bacterium]MDE2505350.1 putative baseplate assembly protein [Burkholderiales bacterium]
MTDPLACLTDPRRDAVRAAAGRNGLDYVEAQDDPPQLTVYFLGKLPPALRTNSAALAAHFALAGGDAITGLVIQRAEAVVDPDPARDDYVVLHLDRCGDRSGYTLTLVGVEGIDPRYASAEFSFRIDCASDVDCRPVCDCAPPVLDEPRPNYLAKDYASFRQLILDRLALVMPSWTERHVPDIGITLVELLAYVGDYLSYYQDAVATEAYLATARQRISVRRHARLVDYRLHEGCNARAWVQVGVSADAPDLLASQLAFLTPYQSGLASALVPIAALANVAPSAYEWYQPLVADPAAPLRFRAAHNAIGFYTWGRRSCCLAAGSTRATLVDGYKADGSRRLQLAVGEVLIFEEVRGARTGLAADADPSHRWAVRLTAVTPADDPLYPVTLAGGGEIPRTAPTPLLEIEWAAADALPFALCLSGIGLAPDCAYFGDISVARGNILLVDHGRTVPAEPLGPVPAASSSACCECEGQPGDVAVGAATFRPVLARTPLTHAQRWPAAVPPAAASLNQGPRIAVPALTLVDDGGGRWTPQTDLFASGADDRDFVAEIDNLGVAHLRFGDGELGRRPAAGQSFSAGYRTGNGNAGNVGADSIACIVVEGATLDGITFTIRNPLPASGGTEPESMEEAKRYAPMAFRRTLERAITAADYAAIAALDPELQGAQAALVWTGSWYEADVALDPWARDAGDAALAGRVAAALERVRRIGHDLRVQRARYVPITLGLLVCVLPGYDRGHVKAAVLARLVGGPSSLFASDELRFGQSVYVSRIVAAVMGVTGVQCVTVTEFHRSGAAPNHEIENGVLPLAADEIAELANDPDHPDRGSIAIALGGGR